MANEVIRIHEQFYSIHVFPARSPVYAIVAAMALVSRKRWRVIYRGFRARTSTYSARPIR